jgi:hypothetical protein
MACEAKTIVEPIHPKALSASFPRRDAYRAPASIRMSITIPKTKTEASLPPFFIVRCA